MASPPIKPQRGGQVSLRLVGVCGAIGVVIASIVFAALSRRDSPKPLPDEPVSFLLTPLSPSPYLNTAPAGQYIGSAACKECHGDRHASFRHSGMGRSMATVDLVREPADAAFDHVPSKRRYEIVRKEGQIWHRELLLGSRPEVVLSEYPVKYVVGSGRHSLTYLCEVDGFLVESPATWYSAKKKWDMSPGYTNAEQIGFERATGEGCLNCHAGRAVAVDGSLHRMKVIEAAISCERCHGPGSLHAARHRDAGPATHRRPHCRLDDREPGTVATRPRRVDLSAMPPPHHCRCNGSRSDLFGLPPRIAASGLPSWISTHSPRLVR